MNIDNLPSKVLEIFLSNEKTYSIYSPKTPFGPNQLSCSNYVGRMLHHIYLNFFHLLNFYLEALVEGKVVREEGYGRAIIFKLTSLFIHTTLKIKALNMDHFE